MTEKKPFGDRIAQVLQIIRESDAPLIKARIHDKLKKATGIKISVHTLDKCLSYLVFDGQIEKTETKGRGNPIEYSVFKMEVGGNVISEGLEDSFSKDIDCIVDIYNRAVEENDNDTINYYNRTHYINIMQKIQRIIHALVEKLYTYSKSKKPYEAGNHFDLFLTAALLPAVRKLKPLVKSPVMSEYTYNMLFNAFDKGSRDIMWTEFLARVNSRTV